VVDRVWDKKRRFEFEACGKECWEFPVAGDRLRVGDGDRSGDSWSLEASAFVVLAVLAMRMVLGPWGVEERRRE